MNAHLSKTKIQKIIDKNPRMKLYMKLSSIEIFLLFKRFDLFFHHTQPDSMNWFLKKEQGNVIPNKENTLTFNGSVPHFCLSSFVQALEIMEHYDLEVVELDMRLLLQIKEAETQFEAFDEYFSKHIGDIEHISVKELLA